VEGEKKDKGHGGGGGVFKGEEVPFRRWEDWERSRLRKIRREERRRRDLERAYPGGFATGDEHLSVFDPTRTFSTYEGSDTHSITSSEEDQWGVQIGGYNEANPAYPPPPVALLVPDEDRLIGATTVAGDELQAILEAGFDDPGPSPPGPAAAVYAPRARVGDSSPTGFPLSGDNGYSALTTTGPWRASSYGMLPESTSPTTPPTGFGTSSGYVSDWQAHVRRRSGGAGGSNGGGGLNGSRERYGPLGPLDPGSGRF
jgi:chitin synthase